MPSTCVVPNCLTNRSGGTKGSCFQVPKNESLRKKWEIAIPGINTLRSYQFVCYKHFEKKAIVTSYTKYDASGNILLKINYQRPKLQTGAVPSIFNNSLKVMNQLPPKTIYEIDHSYALSDNLDVRSAVSGDSSDSNIGVTPIKSDTAETTQDNIASECHVNFTEKENECNCINESFISNASVDSAQKSSLIVKQMEEINSELHCNMELFTPIEKSLIDGNTDKPLTSSEVLFTGDTIMQDLSTVTKMTNMDTNVIVEPLIHELHFVILLLSYLYLSYN